jgi:hypothetical protein
MIDAGERLRPGGGQALPHTDPDEQTAGQAGTARDGDEVEVGGFRAGLPKGYVEQMREALEVVAGGQLRHDAAELFVKLDLGVDDVGEDAAPVSYYRD